MTEPQLVELQEDLSCGGSASALPLDFDAETDDWIPREGAAPIVVHDSCGRCCFDSGDRVWVAFCAQSQRFEELGIFWQPGCTPCLATFTEAQS